MPTSPISGQQIPSPAIPTISEVERIAAQPDPVLRNLQITHCYHRLALGLAKRTGLRANWCTFATWASKQAGQTIRKEDLSRTLADAFGTDAASRQAARDLTAAAQELGVELGVDEIIKFVWKVMDPEAAVARSSDAVARGNLKVFSEIGAEFARFYAACLEDAAYDAEKISGFNDKLRAGEPPEGQRFLRQAFLHYYQALFEEDEKMRTELLLLANIEIGYHEQTRLQPEINEALDAPIISPREFSGNLIKVLRPDASWLTDVVWFLLHLFGRLTAFDSAVKNVIASAQRETQLLLTETMMTIELPKHNRLRLGEDLTSGFPPILQHIDNPELRALLAQVDPTPDSEQGSGAEYWGDLQDRLHFIVDMFRSYELSEDLFDPPFSVDQEAALNEGHMPEGPF